MKRLRHRLGWLTRTTLLLVPTAIVGCASDPPGFSPPRDEEGRVELGKSSLAERNFDARDRHNTRVRFADGMVTPRFTGRFAASDMSVTFDETTGATRTLMAQVGPLTAPARGSAMNIARTFVQQHTDMLGLSAADLADMELTDVVYTELLGTTHIYFRQRHLGVPVYNAQLHINVDKDGRILSVNNTFLPNLGKLARSAAPSIGAEHAVLSAAANLSVDLDVAPSVVASAAPGAGRKTVVEAPGLSRSNVEAELMWVPVNAKQVALVWRFQVETLDGNHHFDYTVDADSGKVWTRIDWTTSDSYRAYKEPVESANHSVPAHPADGRIVILNPADATASPLGWHKDGTNTYLLPRGNNVHAYDDRDANNLPPTTQPACTSTFDCNFALDLTQAPSTYTPAAVSNLFYWNNLIHDVTYQYGFNEVSGNFQVNNFGKGGLGNDAVRAEAQDAGGTNNANFSTPADGSPPRMQMYEWTQTTPRRDGDLDNGIIVHEYGHGISNRLVGGPSNVSCLGNAQQGGEGWSDWFALWFTAEPGDAGTDGRGIGTYALGQPTTGAGIRTQRYSTNPAVNTWTYASINGMAIPHGVGSVWAQALWEVYWALVNKHGYDPNIRNGLGTAGNQRAMLYVTQGLKNTVCSPTFVNARDGIIQAATAAHGGADVCLLWETFAAFGLGTDAVSGGPSSTAPTNGFSIPEACQCQPIAVANAGPDQVACPGLPVTLGTPARPDTTYSWSPGGETTAQITVAPSQTTVYTVTATTSCGSKTDSVTVTASDGETGGGIDETFETGATGWTTTGLWHLANNSTCASPGYSSPTRAFYYGQDATCNYNTGVTNSGTLTSPPITGITSSSTLSFKYFRRVESFSGSYDTTRVDVVRSNGTVVNVFSLSSANPSTTTWQSSPVISMSQFAGDTVRLRFTFNTVDSVSNAFTGWLVDDVKVTGAPSCPTVAVKLLDDPFASVPLPASAFSPTGSR